MKQFHARKFEYGSIGSILLYKFYGELHPIYGKNLGSLGIHVVDNVGACFQTTQSRFD